METTKKVRVLISEKHPEYRLVLGAETDDAAQPAHVRAAIAHLGPWREISQQDFDPADPEHLEAMDDIAEQGAYLRLLSAAYTGRVAISPA